MRHRRKPWSETEMANNKALVTNPTENKGCLLYTSDAADEL